MSTRLTGYSDTPPAVLWDMDGTLVDTEPYWMKCEYALAEKYGGTWTHEDALAVVGGDLIDSATYMREHMGIDRTPEQIVEELLDGVVEMVEREVPWQPGARELLAELRAREVPCALVTMSWRRFVEPVLRALPEGSFDVLVCGDEVAHGKPHPEPYLRAARADRPRARARRSRSRTRRPAPPRRRPPAVRCSSSRATSRSPQGSDARTARRWSGSRRQIWRP